MRQTTDGPDRPGKLFAADYLSKDVEVRKNKNKKGTSFVVPYLDSPPPPLIEGGYNHTHLSLYFFMGYVRWDYPRRVSTALVIAIINK